MSQGSLHDSHRVMPTSSHEQISVVLSLCRELAPKSVLDVGIGFGKYGVLLREYLDIFLERYERASWQIDIGGIEFFAPYENPIWHYVYDWVRIGDALEILPSLGGFDLILLVDVLEHLGRDEGRVLVDESIHHAKYVIVCTPAMFFAQSALCGNEAEVHRSRWIPGDFSRYSSLTVRVPGGFIFLLSKGKIPSRLRWEYSLPGRCLRIVRAAYRAVLPEPLRKTIRLVFWPEAKGGSARNSGE